MSRELGKIIGPNKIAFTQFYGGDKQGVCIQLTGYNCDKQIGYISLTKDEAIETIKKLVSWVLEKNG